MAKITEDSPALIQDEPLKWTQFLIPFLIAFLTIPLLGSFGRLTIILFDLFNIQFSNPNIATLIPQLSGQTFGSITLFYLSKKFFDKKRLKIQSKPTDIKLPFSLFVVAYGIQFITILILNFLLPQPQSSYDSLIPEENYSNNQVAILLFALTIILGASIYEELLFRRMLIPALQRRGLGNLAASIGSALVFALVHTPNDIINGNFSYTLTHFISTFLMGLVASFAFILTNSVLSPIIIHSLFNGTAFLAFLVSYNESTLGLVIFFLYLLLILLGIMVSITWFLVKLIQKKSTMFTKLAQNPSKYPVFPGLLVFVGFFILASTVDTLIEIGIGSIGISTTMKMIITVSYNFLLVGGIAWISLKINPLDLEKEMNIEKPLDFPSNDSEF